MLATYPFGSAGFPLELLVVCVHTTCFKRDACNLHNQLRVLIREAAIFNILEKRCQANTRILKASASLISRHGPYLPFIRSVTVSAKD